MSPAKKKTAFSPDDPSRATTSDSHPQGGLKKGVSVLRQLLPVA